MCRGSLYAYTYDLQYMCEYISILTSAYIYIYIMICMGKEEPICNLYQTVNEEFKKRKEKGNKMKKKLLGICTALCMLITFCRPISVQARSHVHAFSYAGTFCYYSAQLYEHPYYQNGVYKSCKVIGYYYHDKETCGCGAAQYVNKRISERNVELCGMQ